MLQQVHVALKETEKKISHRVWVEKLSVIVINCFNCTHYGKTD